MVQIPKRESNPELSVFANLALDLQDFRDRVVPLAKDMTLLDVSSHYQRDPAVVLEDRKEQVDKINSELSQKHAKELKDK